MKPFFLFAVIIFASFIHTELVSVPGHGGRRKGWNLAKLVLPFGINFDENLRIIVLALGIFVAAPVIVVKWITETDRLAKRRKVRDDNFEHNGGNLLVSRSARTPQLTVYSAQEMESITNSYGSAFPKLGSCCHGGFFRGTLITGAGRREVLVVELERVPQPQLSQFVDQLVFLSRVPHTKNVLRVIGCCLEKLSPLIVYELHGEGTLHPLSECTRGSEDGGAVAGPSPVRTAVGVARGLAYLSSHKCSKSTFVHGDICTATILVDASHNAEVFYAVGSNLIPRDDDDKKNVYRDPEPVSSKSDVYSFGVVLVELLVTGGGRVAFLKEYVHLAKAGRLRENLEKVMASEPGAEMMKEVATMAEMCLNERASKRPSMKEVEEKLSQLMPRD